MLSLSPARESDRDWAAALVRTNMREAYECHGLDWHPEAFEADWAAGENHLLWCEGACVGYLRLHYGEGIGYLQDLQIVAGRRDVGLGARALEAAKARARERRLEALRLKVFADSVAVRFYRRHGFVTLLDEPPLIGMECRLAAAG
ncbi:GNAT family N-acetyltransferase [Halomonas organivorans]|uniref:Ribosomal protein S18 acetylase RimI-like enzyme n=1 Tax=Halomonas organivorans TaxID=257772 RepID=A0A7W5G5M0_9GAMM|nr:ribosomal protein S18 acetylase RimI-like enzyme [Halomonas organivorans]